MLITFIVQGVTIGAYAARLAGVQTKRIATSISLFNLFVTVGRLATLFSVFFIAPLADMASNAVVANRHDPVLAAAWQQTYDVQLRLIILAGTAGMIVFALLLPMFTYLFRARRPFIRAARFCLRRMRSRSCSTPRISRMRFVPSTCRRGSSCGSSTGVRFPGASWFSTSS